MSSETSRWLVWIHTPTKTFFKVLLICVKSNSMKIKLSPWFWKVGNYHGEWLEPTYHRFPWFFYDQSNLSSLLTIPFLLNFFFSSYIFFFFFVISFALFLLPNFFFFSFYIQFKFSLFCFQIFVHFDFFYFHLFLIELFT